MSKNINMEPYCETQFLVFPINVGRQVSEKSSVKSHHLKVYRPENVENWSPHLDHYSQLLCFS